jgi:aspartate aminotransferase
MEQEPSAAAMEMPDLNPFKQADRISAIEVSEIIRITALASKMSRQGRAVISLGAGEPDFDTPQNVKDAAIAAIARGETKYTSLDGTPALKEAIRSKFLRDNGILFETAEITVAAGAKQILFNAMMASLNHGDEVIIPTPSWVSYADIVKIAGGVPVMVGCREENGFRLAANELESAITSRTRWVLINSPGNPTGTTYSAEDYRPLLDVLLRHTGVWLLADDIYEHILYDQRTFVTPAALEPELKSRILTVNGVSKAYAMTGWRIGFAAGPRELIEAMAVVQSQSTSCPSSISQAAAVEALTGSQLGLSERGKSFQDRRDFIVGALNSIDGVSCRKPEGAFYAFANCAGLMGRKAPDDHFIETDTLLAVYLLKAANVALVPGSTFGAPGYLRLSYATSMTDLAEAMSRIKSACERLKA